jgi:hypothetical protein
MAQAVLRFQRPVIRITEAAANAIVSAAMADDTLSEADRAGIVGAIRERQEKARGALTWKGGFVMLNLRQIDAVWAWIRTLKAKDRPGRVRHCFDLILTNLEPETGVVLLTRAELAERLNCRPDHVSAVMKLLRDRGVIIADRMKVAGLRGAGLAVYRVNAEVAWNGHLDNRERQAAEDNRQPSLFEA